MTEREILKWLRDGQIYSNPMLGEFVKFRAAADLIERLRAELDRLNNRGDGLNKPTYFMALSDGYILYDGPRAMAPDLWRGAREDLNVLLGVDGERTSK